MASLQINDLHTSKHLDEKALAAIHGGMGFNWIAAFHPDRPDGPNNPYGTIIGEIKIFNVLLVNPVFNTLNQNEFINVGVSDTVDSVITIQSDQGQAGING